MLESAAVFCTTTTDFRDLSVRSRLLRRQAAAHLTAGSKRMYLFVCSLAPAPYVSTGDYINFA